MSDAPAVFVATVDEFETEIPVVNGKPVATRSREKFEAAWTAKQMDGATPSAGTVAELKTCTN